MRSHVLALACVIALLITAFPPTAIAQGGPRAEVTVGEVFYEPASLTVAPGTTVAWTNLGAEFHTVTSFDGVFDSGVLLPGDAFELTFAEPGDYWYFCQIHEGQEGVVTVAAPVGAPEPAPTPPSPPATPPEPLPAPPAAPLPTAPARPSAPMSASVSIQGFSFQPASVTVAVGGTVTWTNQDGVAHTATGSGISTGTLNRGQSGTATFSRAGTVSYQCSIHPSMTGQVVVVG